MFEWILSWDWSTASFLLAGLSFGKSSSESQQQSAGPLGAVGGGRREQGLDAFADYLFGRGGSTNTGLLEMLSKRTGTPIQYSTPLLSERGLTQEQEAAFKTPFQQAVGEAFSRVSGNYANRGFNRPEAIGAIAGSAAQNVAPRFAELFANLAAQNVGQRTQAPLVLEDVQRSRINDFLAALGVNIEALGGTSSGQARSSQFNAGVLQNLSSLKT